MTSQFVFALFLQSGSSSASSWINSYVLPITGVGIIVYSLWFSPRLVQYLKFDGFGLKLEITTLALMLLTGVGMMSAGFIFYALDVNGKEKKAEEKAQQEEVRANSAERFTIKLALSVPEEAGSELRPIGRGPGHPANNLICRYQLSSRQTPDEVPVIQGDEETLEVLIPDMSRNDVISDLVIEPADSSKNAGEVMISKSKAIYPLFPRVNLAVSRFHPSAVAP